MSSRSSLDITEVVKQLQSTKIAEIVSSPLSTTLLWCYSELYLFGGQCRFCERSQTQYWNEILRTGTERAIMYKESKERTCVPNWKGHKYCPQLKNNICSSLIGDNQAIDLLLQGVLKESDFEKLPNEYVEVIKTEKKIVIDAVVEPIKEQNNEVVNERGRKKTIRKSK